jgi:hypothetical protein
LVVLLGDKSPGFTLVISRSPFDGYAKRGHTTLLRLPFFIFFFFSLDIKSRRRIRRRIALYSIYSISYCCKRDTKLGEKKKTKKGTAVPS